MKKIQILLVAVCLIGACTSGRKKVTQSIEYTVDPATVSSYDFTSYERNYDPLLPSVINEMELPEETQPGEDEDFTSENISSSYGTYGDVVITVATRKFKLGANATRKEIALFRQSMDSAYAAALRTYRPTGFTYSLSSVGAVNPLSDIQVTCKMSEQSANAVGQSTCADFFKQIAAGYVKLSTEAK